MLKEFVNRKLKKNQRKTTEKQNHSSALSPQSELQVDLPFLHSPKLISLNLASLLQRISKSRNPITMMFIFQFQQEMGLMGRTQIVDVTLN
jgi:hypothetical protein